MSIFGEKYFLAGRDRGLIYLFWFFSEAPADEVHTHVEEVSFHLVHSYSHSEEITSGNTFTLGIF